MHSRSSRLLGLGRYLFMVAIWAGCSTSAQSAPGGEGGLSLNLGDAQTMNCSPSDTAAAGAPDVCSMAATIDYARDVFPTFSRCSGEICHNFQTSADVRWFIGRPTAECCGERKLIVPGHPEQSYLLDKLRGTNLCDGARMPLDGPTLSTASIDALSAWICRGATTPD